MAEQVDKALPPQFLENAKKKKEEEEKEKASKAEKDAAAMKSSAGVTEDELRKSLDKLEGVVVASPSGRKKELFAKALSEAITPEENAELLSLMSGASLEKGLAAQIGALTQPSDTLQKSVLDVSPFLRDTYAAVIESLSLVSDSLEKSEVRHQEQVVVLAKGLLDIGKVAAESLTLAKSLQASLSEVLRQPVGARRSAPTTSTAQLMEKSFGGQSPGGAPQQLQKGQILDILTKMNEASPDGMSKSGERLDLAVSKFEQLNQISTPLLAEVHQVVRNHGQNGASR